MSDEMNDLAEQVKLASAAAEARRRRLLASGGQGQPSDVQTAAGGVQSMTPEQIAAIKAAQQREILEKYAGEGDVSTQQDGAQ